MTSSSPLALSSSSLVGLQQELTKQETLLRQFSSVLPDKGVKIRLRIKQLQEEISRCSSALSSTPPPASLSVSSSASRASVQLDELDVHERNLLIRAHLTSHPSSSSSFSSFTSCQRPPHRIATSSAPLDENVLSSLLSCLTLHEPVSRPSPRISKDVEASLFPHQTSAVAWMIKRERNTDERTPKGGFLCDDCGLGKTLTVIALIVDSLCFKPDKADIVDEEREDKKEGLDGGEKKEDEEEESGYDSSDTDQISLIVCPRGLVSQWQHQFAMHCSTRVQKLVSTLNAPSAGRIGDNYFKTFKIIITSYETIRCEAGRPDSVMMRTEFARVVLDEAHRIRNHRTMQAQAVCKIQARARWLLTATPINNSLQDLYSSFLFLRYKPYDEEAAWKLQMNAKDGKGLERARTLLKATMLRRTKLDRDAQTGLALIRMSEKTITRHNCELRPFESRFYSHFRTRCVELTRLESKANYATMLTMLLRLRQCADHFLLTLKPQKKKKGDEANETSNSYVTIRTALKESAQAIGLKIPNLVEAGVDCVTYDKLLVPSTVNDAAPSSYSKCLLESSKISKIVDLLREVRAREDEKCVIFSQFTSYLDLISNALDYVGFTDQIARFDGEQTIEQQRVNLTRFNESSSQDCFVLLVSLTAGGTGLDLTRGNHVIVADLWFNPQLQNQAFDRVHRLSQKRPVFIHLLCAHGTVEAELLDMQNKKSLIAKRALEPDAKAQTEDDNRNKASSLSLDALRRLFHVDK